MRFNALVLAAALAASIGLPPALADDAPAAGAANAAPDASLEPFAGKWVGPWRLGMNSGHVELVLTTDPKQPGTIAITNLVKFGDPPEPLWKVVADGKKIQFRSSGVDNSTMKVSLEFTAENELSGMIVHDGFTNLCKLTRVH